MKVLYIPHSPMVPHVRTRAEELAKQLAKKYQLYYLSWGTSDSGNLLSKLSLKIQQRFKPEKKYSYYNFTVLSPPYSDFYYIKARTISETILQRSLKFNKKILRKVIEVEGIDIIINEARRLWDSTNLGIPYLYDISDIAYDGVFKHFMKKQMVSANKLMCVSHFIKERIRNQLGLRSAVVPNGVNLEEFRETKNYESAYPSRIIGCIGNHGWWSGLGFLLNVFKRLHDDYELWIIGGGSELPNAKRKVEKEKIRHVKFIGPVPKNQIINYFKTIDLGVLPFRKTVFTDAALPIKVLEFVAAKKFVLATDLEELKTLKLSNLVLRGASEQLWAEAIDELSNSRWNSKWDREIEKYDWKFLAKKVQALVEEL